MDGRGRSRSSPPTPQRVFLDESLRVHRSIPRSVTFDVVRNAAPTPLTFLLPQKSSGELPGTSSLLSCTINLASTCMGTGILALPAAYNRAGLILGNVLCIAASLFAALSLYFLDRAATATALAEPDFFSVRADAHACAYDQRPHAYAGVRIGLRTAPAQERPLHRCCRRGQRVWYRLELSDRGSRWTNAGG